jgi:hypothetical protein
VLIYAFSFFIVIAFGISWFRFYQAAINPALNYFPLESYFFTAQYSQGEELYNRPYFFISYFDYKPTFIEKLSYEIFIWVLCILAILIVLQLLSSHEWFKLDKKKELPIIGDFLKWLSVKLQSKNNIFNLGFKEITIVSISFAVVFLFMIPNDSSDMYGYLARGAQQIDFGLNPYHHTIAEISNWWNMPLYANINSIWSYNPAPYGPIYMLIYAGLAFLSLGNFYLAIFIFKLFNLGVFATLLLVLAKILDDTDFESVFYSKKFSDSRQIFSYKKIVYSLVALNPFLIFETLWNGHNDLFMGLMILLALYNAFKNNFNVAIIFLTISILSKYVSLILLPFFIILFFSQGIRRFPIYGALISGSLLAFLYNYFQPFAIRFNEISNNILLCHKSLQRSVNTIYKAIVGMPMAPEANLIFLGLFGIVLLFLCYKFLYSENKRLSIFHFSFLALFALIFIFSAKFHSWYLLMILPFAVLIHPRFMMLLSLSHLLSFTFLDQANLANFLVMTLIPSVIYFKFLVKEDL